MNAFNCHYSFPAETWTSVVCKGLNTDHITLNWYQWTTLQAGTSGKDNEKKKRKRRRRRRIEKGKRILVPRTIHICILFNGFCFQFSIQHIHFVSHICRNRKKLEWHGYKRFMLVLVGNRFRMKCTENFAKRKKTSVAWPDFKGTDGQIKTWTQKKRERVAGDGVEGRQAEKTDQRPIEIFRK